MFNKIKGLFIRKPKKPKVKKDTRLLLPFVNIHDGYIEMKDGVMDIMQIKTRDLHSMSESDLEYLFMVETRFLRSFQDSYKEVTLNFPTNADRQRRYWSKVRMRTNKPVLLDFIDRKLFELDFLENERTNREYFVFIYAEDESSLKTKKEALVRAREGSFPVFDISNQKKRDVLFLINNQNSKIVRRDSVSSENEDLSEEDKSLQFISEIQPQGGVKFEDKFISKGDGYEAIVHVWSYPTQVTVFWLEKITSKHNLIAFRDIATMNKESIIDSINKSMLEHDVRYRSAKEESSRMDAESGYQEMEALYRQMREMGEEVKLVSIRLVVHAPTVNELEKKVSKVLSDLSGENFRGSILLNQTSSEWQSMFLPYEKQLEFSNKREGKGIPSMPVASGLPYNFSDLNDKNGSYLGLSSTDGNILFDLFHVDDKRRFYNGVVVGKMGAGKSTLLKKLTFDNASRGNFIRGFDVTGEFEKLVDTLGGYSISLDGSQGIINPLEIFKTQDSSANEDYDPDIDSIKDQDMSFMMHITKVATIYQYLSADYSGEEVEEFKNLLRGFYKHLGFEMGTGNITNRPASDYPTFEELLEYVKRSLYVSDSNNIIKEELTPSRVARLEKIVLVLDNLVNAYGHIFNGHTTIPDFATEQIVFFSIRNLTGLERGVFNAQMYSALNMIWDNLIQIGSPQLMRSSDPDFDLDSATRLLVLIDEAHRMVNADNMLAVSFLTDFAREARKYFGGLMLASQSIRDFVPEGSDSDTVGKIKTLFELTQYKFIMQQDANTLSAMTRIFEGEMSDSDLTQIPQFERGDCLLSISGVENIRLKVEASDEELRLFTGGV